MFALKWEIYVFSTVSEKVRNLVRGKLCTGIGPKYAFNKRFLNFENIFPNNSKKFRT